MYYADTIPGLLDQSAALAPDAPYLVRRAGDRLDSVSYRETVIAVNALAASLMRSGLHRGDRVALLSENSREWVVTYLAVLRAGCVAVPLDVQMPVQEISHVLSHCRAAQLLCSAAQLDKLDESEEKLRPAVPVRELTSVESLLVEPDSAASFPELHPRDLAVIIYTSGTTGHAKGVMLSHRNVTFNVESCRKVCEITEHDNFLVLLPLHHTFSATVNMLLSMACGARATLATSYRSRDVVDDVRISGVTVLVGVPQVFENMMNGLLRAVAKSGFPKQSLFQLLFGTSRLANRLGLNIASSLFRSTQKKAGLQTVRLMVSGGAALHPDINRFFQNLGFDLTQGYGLTETSPVLSVNPARLNKIGSVGPALDGVQLHVEQPNDDGIGEIWASGDNIMLGYYENEAATRDVMHDGWLRTGDAGYLDADGYLFITGRIKNIIVTAAGKNVYPEEIESRLESEPVIAEALVIGVKRREERGEDICALLRLDPDVLETLAAGDKVDPQELAAEIVRRYNEDVAAYRRIREWKIVEEEFTKTSTRKIKRYLYRDAFSKS